MPQDINTDDLPIRTARPIRNVPIRVPQNFISSAMDGARSFAIEPVKDFAALALNEVVSLRKGAEQLGLGFEPKTITPALTRVAKSVNDWTVSSDTYHQYRGQDDNTPGRITGEALGFVGLGVASVASGGLSEAGIAAKGVQGAEEATSMASSMSEDAASVQREALGQNKAAWAGGFVGRLAKFNAFSMPYIMGSSTKVNNEGNIDLSLGDFAKNLAIANTLPFAVELAPYARSAMTKIGTQRVNAAYDHALKTEVPTPEESIDRSKEIPKTSISDSLPQVEKDYLDDLAKHGKSKENDAYIVDSHIDLLPGNGDEYARMVANPHRIGFTLDKAIRAVISKGMILDGEHVDINDVATQVKVNSFINKIDAFYGQKGIRQVYLNDKIQSTLVKSNNKELLNDLDKRLFDAKPYRSTGAIRSASTGAFMKAESTGIRTFNYPEWYRVRKTDVDNEALDKLHSLANKGDESAQYMRAIYSENLVSQHMHVTEPFLKDLKKAIENPVPKDEIDSAIKSYYEGSKEEAAAEMESNIKEVQKELEGADFKEFTGTESPRYVKLLQNINKGKLRAYITCMIG